MKRKTTFSKLHGFTLIELLTVIAVIAILAGILIPAVGTVQRKAREAKTRSQFNQYATALQQFKGEYGYYPAFPTAGNGSNGDSVVAINEGTNYDTFYGIMTGRVRTTGDQITNADDAYKYNRKRLSFYTFSDGEIASEDDAASLGVEAGVILTADGNSDIHYVVDTNLNGIIDKQNLTASATTASEDRAQDFQGSIIFYAKEDTTQGFRFISSIAGWD